MNTVFRKFIISSVSTKTVPTLCIQRGYKNFGHKPEPTPGISKFFYVFLATGLILSSLDFRWCRMLYLRYTNQIEDDHKYKTDEDDKSDNIDKNTNNSNVA